MIRLLITLCLASITCCSERVERQQESELYKTAAHVTVAPNVEIFLGGRDVYYIEDHFGLDAVDFARLEAVPFLQRIEAAVDGRDFERLHDLLDGENALIRYGYPDDAGGLELAVQGNDLRVPIVHLWRCIALRNPEARKWEVLFWADIDGFFAYEALLWRGDLLVADALLKRQGHELRRADLRLYAGRIHDPAAFPRHFRPCE